MNIWNDQEALAKADQRRIRYRAEGKRLAFDCLNLKCNGERGNCSLNKKLSLSKDGSIDIRLILNGITPSVCSECKSFLPDED